LICNGETAHIFEVNSESKTLWEFTQPFGGELNRDGRANDPVELARQALEKNSHGARGATEEGTALFRAIKYAADYPPFCKASMEPLDPQPVPFAAMVNAELEKLRLEQSEADNQVPTG
jgi:hypothetical protein